jgi:hypothetical protein
MGTILSYGFFPYIKVEAVGDEDVFRRLGRLYVQVSGENNFNWYHIDYSFESEEWGNWEGPYTEDDIAGTFKPDGVINWVSYPNVLRGAAGTGEDANPLWIGYIFRRKVDDKGYFRDYTYTPDHPDGEDMAEANQVKEMAGFEDIEAGLQITPWATNRNGYVNNDTTRFMLMPEYDGTQIAPHSKISTLVVSSLTYLPNVVDFLEFIAPSAQYEIGCRIKFWPGADPPPALRLTALHLYRSKKSVEENRFPPWEKIRRIDIREGTEHVVESRYGECYSPVEEWTHGIKIEGSAWYSPDSYTTLWIEIHIITGTGETEEVVERYKIKEVATSDVNTYIMFNADGNTNLDYGTRYYFKLTERWSPTTLGYVIGMLSYGTEISLGDAPPWAPDPNRIDEVDYRPPDPLANYKHAIFAEDVNIVGNVRHDDEYKPLQFRESFSSLDELAGDDLFSLKYNVPARVGDEIMGFGKKLLTQYAEPKQLLSVFTKESIFRYIRDANIPILQETVHNIGLKSSKSLNTHGEVHRFLGVENNRISVYKYDAIEKPKDIGDPILPDIEEALARDGVSVEDAKGWYDGDVNQYRLCIYAPSIATGHSFVSNQYQTLITQSGNKIFQKNAAFRYGETPPGQIYTFVTDIDASDNVHRYMHMSEDNATFELVLDWVLGSGNLDSDLTDVESRGSAPSVSFVIESGGRYMHAVSEFDYNLGGGIYRHMLIYRRFDLDDLSVVDQTIIGDFSNTNLLGWKTPDIILDHRTGSDKKPIVVTRKAPDSGTDQSWIFWYDTANVLQSRQINGSVTPQDDVSIAGEEDHDRFYVHANYGSGSRLYRMFYLASGVPIIPDENNFEPLPDGSVGMTGAQMAFGGGSLGFIGTVGGSLSFREYKNEALTDIETITANAEAQGCGGCWRGNKWQVIAGKTGSDFLHWFRREGEDDWADMALPVQPGQGEWNEVAVTMLEHNPSPRGGDEFGAMIIENVANVKYVHIFEGAVATGTVFGFDVDSDAATIVSGNARFVPTYVEDVNNEVLFTDEKEFMLPSTDYKEWFDGTDYDNHAFLVTLKAIDGGSTFLKQAGGLIVEWDGTVDADSYLYVQLVNEKGDMKELQLTQDDNGKPQKFVFWGRYFIPTIFESSQYKFTLKRFELWGKSFGGKI